MSGRNQAGVSIVQWLDGWRRDRRCLADTQSHTHSQRRRPTTDRVHGQPSRRVAGYQRFFLIFTPQSIVANVSVSVCLSANIISGTSCRIFTNFLWMPQTAVAQSLTGGDAIRYSVRILPVLWTASCSQEQATRTRGYILEVTQ